MTLTIAKEYAEQIRDGQKEFEARYLKDTGAKLGSLVRGDKIGSDHQRRHGLSLDSGNAGKGAPKQALTRI